MGLRHKAQKKWYRIMSSIVTSSLRRAHDHFEPEAALDPAEQRKLRGYLEQIDFAAFAANRETLRGQFAHVSLETFERLAVAAAHARGEWVSAAIAVSETKQTPNVEQVAQLAHARQAFEELADAYEALRRLVERGYASLSSKSAQQTR
ncbi:MAG: hypothetical protein ABW199_10385 [Caulobacterales bacterium]